MEGVSPELQKQLDGIMGKLDTVSNDNATLKKENAELKQQLLTVASNGAIKTAEEAKEPKVPAGAFTVAGKKYKFNTAKFIVPGIGEVTALDALADKTTYDKLAIDGKAKTIKDWLVAKDSGVIEDAAAAAAVE